MVGDRVGRFKMGRRRKLTAVLPSASAGTGSLELVVDLNLHGEVPASPPCGSLTPGDPQETLLTADVVNHLLGDVEASEFD